MKRRKTRSEISLFGKKEDKSDTGDDIDLDQADTKYSLLLQYKEWM